MSETKRLGIRQRLAALIAGSSPGTSVVKVEKKAANLLPQGMNGIREFFSPDGGRTMYDTTSLSQTALAFAAYWYVATRWRAQKIAEAPPMVVEVDEVSGAEEWLSDHDLEPVLEEPSVDYDMGELLERTSRYLDDTAECLWVVDADGTNTPRRLTPFKGGEFEVKSDSTRLYAQFIVQTAQGPTPYTPEQVCYFRDSVEGWTKGGKSRLQVAMSWLQLGEKSRQTIKELLENSVWPSLVLTPDKDWNPDPAAYEEYKADIESYGHNKGRPFVMLGGGSAEALTAKIRDLVPGEVLDRVESVVAAVSGVPAIVLQFQIGLVNSPWSQMAQARMMAYDDTVQPAWGRIARVLTRQLLRPLDEDTTHFIRFDTSQIAALKVDRQAAATTAGLLSRIATLNERRVMVDLEPSKDPKADLIPELTQPTMADMLAAQAGKPPVADPTAPPDKTTKVWPAILSRKAQTGGLVHAMRNEAMVVWKIKVNGLLATDRDQIAGIVEAFLTDAVHKSLEAKERGKGRVIAAVTSYLKTDSAPAWAKATTPLLVQGSERATAIVAADLAINYNLLHPSLLKFAQRESAELITNVSTTTRDAVNAVVTAGLEAGLTTKEISANVREAAAFASTRADLVARTETTRAFNGAPNEALRTLGRETGRKFTKTWSGALDDRERDEHVAIEGETVGIDEVFSNGLQFPGEPNCRCVALNNEVTE